MEREYELPDAWSNAIIGFSPNTSPIADRSSSSEAMFYPDPSHRVFVLTARSPPEAGVHPTRNWLIINESYFRPTSRKDRLKVPWNQWNQYCLIRDISPSVRGPHVMGNRVLFAESASVHSGGTHLSGYAPRLNVIDFAPYPDSECRQSRAWSLIGQRSVLVPNESSREVPPKTVDGRRIDDMRVTEDNIILFLVSHSPLQGFVHQLMRPAQEKRNESRPVNILTFGAPLPTRSRHEMHSPQL